MQFDKKHILLLLIFHSCFIAGAGLLAQSSISSPYSMYGVGNIENPGTNKNISLGGGGLALQSGDFINITNPASLSGLTNEKMMLDFGISSQYTKSASKSTTQSAMEGNLQHILLGFNAAKNWGMALSLSPYSSVNYMINTTKTIEGSTYEYTNTLEGSGGIYQAAWSNGYALTKNLSVGIKSSFLMGSIIKTETFNNSNFNFTISSDKTYYFNNLLFDFGIRYSFNLKKTNISLAANYTPQKALYTKSNQLTYANTSDTLNYNTLRVNDYNLPENVGVGMAIKLPNTMTIVADYKFQKWGGINQTTTNEYKINDSHRFSFGVEIAPSKEQYRSVLRRLKYQFGAYTTNSYLNIKGKDIVESGITAGIQIPLKNRESAINLSYQYGVKGEKTLYFIKENNHRITLGINLSENWFSKQKFQ